MMCNISFPENTKFAIFSENSINVPTIQYLVKMSLKDFQMLQKLGEGAYSTVFKVKRLIDNELYALKKVKMNNLTQRQKQNALTEVRILASINHPNIISYKEAFIEKGTNYLCIVMEYADDGDLFAKIKQHIKLSTRFSEEEVWSIFIQITQGLKVLHDMKILHRDIKSANIFLTKSGQAKLGDLNVSKMMKSMSQTQTGTPYYASPEIWKDQPYDKKSDIWSLGCVFYQIMALKPPFRANDMEGLYKKVARGFYSKLPPQYSSQFSVVLKLMLQVAPHLRSTCNKILEFPIVQKNMLFLPESILAKYSRFKGEDLMKTIRIDQRIGSVQLKNQVQLPKPRYGTKVNYQEELIKSSRNISNFGGLNHHSNARELQRLVLPSISKTIDHHESKKQKMQSKELRRQLNQLLGSQKVKLLKRGASNSLVESLSKKSSKVSARRDVNHSIMENNSIHSKNNLNKRYEGRVRQLSPDIIHKILKNQRQRHKIKSIIGNN